jgi:PAS domain S-box-containing protein
MAKKARKSKKQRSGETEVARLRSDLAPFVVSAETTRMAMVFTNAKEVGNPIVFANDSFLELTGYDRDEVLGQDFDFLAVRNPSAEALAKIRAALDGKPNGELEILYHRKDKSEFLAAVFICPVRDESDEIVQYFASFVDLTKHRDAEQHLQALINELNHRVKNTLATVQAIVRQVLRTEPDPKVARDAIESRLFALSRSHDLLTRENWRGAGLRDVLETALAPFGVTTCPVARLTISGDNIRFPPRTALALGIAFNELATNALKYGALSNASGDVAVTWSVEATQGGDRVLLRWQERGVPPVAPPARKGFGSQMIERGLAQELNGTVQLDYRPEGFVCTMEFLAP